MFSYWANVSQLAFWVIVVEGINPTGEGDCNILLTAIGYVLNHLDYAHLFNQEATSNAILT